MEADIDKIYKGIVRDLKKSGMYSPHLNITIYCLASATLTLVMANNDILKLSSTRALEESKYGSKPMEDPAFKTQRGAMAEVFKWVRILKLTVENLVGVPDQPGPIDDLADKLMKIR